MTRIEHLNFCSICIHQKDDMRKGILCGLTDRIADFEDHCDSFTEDPDIIDQIKLKEIEHEITDKMASQGKRFLNYLLDTLFIVPGVYVLAILSGAAIGLFVPALLPVMEEHVLFVGYLICFVTYTLYYLGFEAATGRSIAKYITRTKVVTESGEKPGFKMILIRTLCRFIPIEPLSVLFNDGSGWHDTISKTKVINC